MQAFVIASGPSLTQQDCDLVSAWRGSKATDAENIIIAVNLSWRMVPKADILFAGDEPFWSHEPYRNEIGACFRGELWTASPKAAKMYRLELLKAPLLTNSGANAIRLAQQLGADWIGLLGFDYGPADDGKLHWHDDHAGQHLTNSGQFETPEIEKLALELRLQGVEVVNCSRLTRLECFPRMDLERVI